MPPLTTCWQRLPKRDFSEEDIKPVLMVNEAVRCLEEALSPPRSGCGVGLSAPGFLQFHLGGALPACRRAQSPGRNSTLKWPEGLRSLRHNDRMSLLLSQIVRPGKRLKGVINKPSLRNLPAPRCGPSSMAVLFVIARAISPARNPALEENPRRLGQKTQQV